MRAMRSQNVLILSLFHHALGVLDKEAPRLLTSQSQQISDLPEHIDLQVADRHGIIQNVSIQCKRDWEDEPLVCHEGRGGNCLFHIEFENLEKSEMDNIVSNARWCSLEHITFKQGSQDCEDMDFSGTQAVRSAVQLCERNNYRYQVLRDGSRFYCNPEKKVGVPGMALGLFVDGLTFYMKQGFVPTYLDVDDGAFRLGNDAWCKATEEAKTVTVQNAIDKGCFSSFDNSFLNLTIREAYTKLRSLSDKGGEEGKKACMHMEHMMSELFHNIGTSTSKSKQPRCPLGQSIKDALENNQFVRFSDGLNGALLPSNARRICG